MPPAESDWPSTSAFPCTFSQWTDSGLYGEVPFLQKDESAWVHQDPLLVIQKNEPMA